MADILSILTCQLHAQWNTRATPLRAQDHQTNSMSPWRLCKGCPSLTVQWTASTYLLCKAYLIQIIIYACRLMRATYHSLPPQDRFDSVPHQSRNIVILNSNHVWYHKEQVTSLLHVYNTSIVHTKSNHIEHIINKIGFFLASKSEPPCSIVPHL